MRPARVWFGAEKLCGSFVAFVARLRYLYPVINLKPWDSHTPLSPTIKTALLLTSSSVHGKSLAAAATSTRRQIGLGSFGEIIGMGRATNVGVARGFSSPDGVR